MNKKIDKSKVKQKIQIHNADCMQYLKTMEDNSIDCVITDPPYFIDKLDNNWSSKNIKNDKKNSHIKHLPKGMKFDKKQVKKLYDYYLELSKLLFWILMVQCDCHADCYRRIAAATRWL